ncbi:L-serine ammonia-lyase [Cryptococcus neoformans]|nr:L-serine ammonia-lyase [Cryptococcus neoformans var. grubii]OXC61085.1 L-serine ammonia-lyase [Cryptococcus neoformans var. grubii MW-RSA852]
MAAVNHTFEDPKNLPWIKTPLVRSAALSKLAGCDILLKLENIQPSGSFKSRGIGNLVLQSVRSASPDTPLHFYSSSGGNAGLACVTAASTLGYPSSVIVPLSTKPFMIDKLRAAGATEVIQTGQTWFEADKHLREDILAKDPNGIYVPPFDHSDIWQGAATMVDEIVQELTHVPDAVVCSVGGGGLMIGVCKGLERLDKGRKAKVVAVETLGAESLHKSIEAGQLITLPGITSLATSLGATTVAAKALEYGLQPQVRSIVVSDKEALEACLRFLDDERILVEPACGATLAMVYSGKLKDVLELDTKSKVVLVICGGSNISLELIEGYKEMI